MVVEKNRAGTVQTREEQENLQREATTSSKHAQPNDETYWEENL